MGNTAQPARTTTDIAIIGAGVIGLTIALELVEQGRDVALVDPGTPGMGASYCHLCDQPGRHTGRAAVFAVAPFQPNLAAGDPASSSPWPFPMASALPAPVAAGAGKAQRSDAGHPAS
jgi:choline dehydrogenase-like flavoprotein